jgi:hypothetical protein
VTTTPTADTGPSTDRRFFGHPLALGSLFSVELWERFSFYGMQTVMAWVRDRRHRHGDRVPALPSLGGRDGQHHTGARPRADPAGLRPGRVRPLARGAVAVDPVGPAAFRNLAVALFYLSIRRAMLGVR